MRVVGPVVPLPAGMDLPVRSGTPGHIRTPLLTLDEGRLLVDGTDSAVEPAVEALRLRLPSSGFAGSDSNMPPPWSLAVDGAATWGEVVPLLNGAAAAGSNDVVLLFGRSVTEPAPPRSAITPEMERIAALTDDRVMEMVRAIDTVFASCKPAWRAFSDLPVALTDEERQVWLARRLAQSVGACGCTGDLASIRSFMWAFSGPGGGTPVSSVQVRISTAAEAVEVALPTTTPWKEAADRVIAAGAGGKAVRAVAK